ncbi:MAG: metallophosphoesterase [Gemmataceae bacterium]|nr:metallophosphoesterase [Gemmataceae bacterium]
MKAIISDIHGNLEALIAVLEDIKKQGVTQRYCLGDVVGYGPNPRECLDLVTDFDMVLMGNHDNAAIFDPEGFNPAAEQAIFWTRDQLEQSHETTSRRQDRLDFLSIRPKLHREDPYLFVHGSARNPTNEYVFPDDIYNQRKMDVIFQKVPKTCFQGHTHVPGIFTQLESNQYQFQSPDQFDNIFFPGEQKIMCNVGSVGQPRDLDPRACYVILDDSGRIHFHRVTYDLDKTVKKIHAIPELNNFLGDRLRQGR